MISCDLILRRVAFTSPLSNSRHLHGYLESMNSRTAKAFPDEAILCCHAGTAALQGNLHESAAMSYRQALALNPMLWEAFEGLCAIGVSAIQESVLATSCDHVHDTLRSSQRVSCAARSSSRLGHISLWSPYMRCEGQTVSQKVWRFHVRHGFESSSAASALCTILWY